MNLLTSLFFFFFFNDTATTEIYTLSLHDALPIFSTYRTVSGTRVAAIIVDLSEDLRSREDLSLDYLLKKRDRKSTRLNSSHGYISYAVFCLKKKTNRIDNISKYTTSYYTTTR